MNSFALFPVIDLIIPQDWSNPTEEQKKYHTRYDLKFRLPLYFWTAIELATTYKMIEMAVNKRNKFSFLDTFGTIVILSIFNGAVGINTAHELLHKPNRLEFFLANVLLANVNYMHWAEEHVTGHHERVATYEDPATARLNESFFAFLPRTLHGSYVSAMDIEHKRMQQAGQKSLFHNSMLWKAIIPFVHAIIIATVAKKRTGGNNKTILVALIIFYAQGIGSASLLEAVNYVEHYGLQRQKLSDESYEPGMLIFVFGYLHF